MAQNPDYNKPTNNPKVEEIDITSIPEFDIKDWDLDNPKAYLRFITRIERICRNSFEYKQFINFLRDNAGFNKCSIMENVSNEENRAIKIHVHHYPLTLYDIVWTIANKHKMNHESMDEDMIAKEVMYSHYTLHVGLIPLSESVHEMNHNSRIFIPTWAVLGKWRTFVEEYKQYMSSDTLSNLEKLDELSQKYNHADNTEILDSGYVRLKIDDPDYQATTKELYDHINKTLDEIKSKQKQ